MRKVFDKFFSRFVYNQEYIFIIILLICLCFVSYSISRSESEYWSSFGINLFSGFCGSFVSIFLIDRMIRERDIRQNIPYRIAIYDDVRLILAWEIGLWREAYRIFISGSPPQSFSEMLAEENIDSILRNLRFHDNANTHPVMNWHSFMLYTFKKIESRADSILKKYGSEIDPNIIIGVNKFCDQQRIQLLNIIGPAGVSGEIKSRVFNGENFCQSALMLRDWLDGEYKYLKRKGYMGIFPPPN